MAQDPKAFDALCKQFETYLGRPLTADERQALRASFPAVDTPILFERRKAPRPDENSEAAKVGE